MRIAVWHNLPSGGGKRALHDHVRGLVLGGHQIEVWCPPQAEADFLPLRDLAVEHIVPMADEPTNPLLRGIDRAAGGALATLSRLRALEEHSRLCAEAINDRNFDLLLSGSASGFAITGLARYVSAPSVLYLQEPLRWLFEASQAAPWSALPSSAWKPSQLVRRVRDVVRVEALRVQVREAISGARAYDRILTNSYYSRESVLRAYGVESQVCYLGVDTDHFVDRGLDRDRLVVGIGAFFPHKRIEVAVEAVAGLPSPRPTLVWIGNAARAGYLPRLREQADRLSVDFIPMLGVPDSKLLEVLNRAAAMIYAPRLEPFGYAPLEAAACGVPVIARAEGGVRESIIDGVTGRLVDTDAELTDALAEVLENGSLAHNMRGAARQNVERFWTVQQATSRLERRLLEVIEEPGFDRARPERSN